MTRSSSDRWRQPSWSRRAQLARGVLPVLVITGLIASALPGRASAQLLPPGNPPEGLGGAIGGVVGLLPPVGDTERPRVTSAGSTGNTLVVVQFSEAMADNATNPANYSIVQENVHPEVGGVAVSAARFATQDRLSVELKTSSQNEVTYRVKVSNVTDRAGNPLAEKTTSNGVFVDPTSATFAGTPPTGDERVDRDGDGLFDHEEVRGWVVTIQLANGTIATREVTSSLNSRDTDNDGLDDFTEKGLVLDPRDDDTDDDGLGDVAEFNEIYSDPSMQDSEGDGLTDGLEINFFRTSAILADTDGDQIADGKEVNLANRNPRVADLPSPALEIGQMNLALDVRFVESTSNETREIDSRSTTASLAQSNRQEFSNTSARTMESSTTLSTTVGFEFGFSASSKGPSSSFKSTFSATAEKSFSSSFTSSFTETSSRETQRAYESSLATSAERAEGANVTREVHGGRAQVAVTLRSAGNIAFTIKNLQVTALIQDPQNPARLTPVATLLPDAEPDSGFNLGPLVPQRGPIVFSSDQVFPQMVEDLMRNPRSLVFRFANYDITDELGRNFAFTSQDINDRTAGLVLDFGGFDRDGDGRGDDSEIHRVATGIGRRVDTNGDDVIDDRDRYVVYDQDGGHVGITLREALRAIGLAEYDETTKPTATLSAGDIRNSYSTIKLSSGAERLYRIRGTAAESRDTQGWEILTDTGIDRTVGLDEVILRPDTDVTLGFFQDADQDGIPAVLETVNNCSDRAVDTDGEQLDDRFEVLLGWDVGTDRGRSSVRSTCSKQDTDGDGLSDAEEAPGVLERDERGLIRFDEGHKPRRDTSATSDPFEVTLVDPTTDPTTRDTDGDSLGDGEELIERTLRLFDGTQTEPLKTSPEFFDSDGDTASDGVEQRVGGNPRESDQVRFGDNDGDGLVNIQESQGYEIRVRSVSSTPAICDSARSDASTPCDEGAETTRVVISDPNVRDSDSDGLSDGEEFRLSTDARTADTDGDGVSDVEEVRGITLPKFGFVVTDPNDADTDNDKRKDGDEANRGPRFVVRVAGESPYEAFSSPLAADADLDRLADGDEVGAGTDPAKDNTDGDNRSDYEEVSRGGRRPLVPDLRVTATFGLLKVNRDGDDGDMGAGNFEFDFGIRNPQTGQVMYAVNDNRVSDDVPDCLGDHDRNRCWDSQNSWLQMQSGQDPFRFRDNHGVVAPTLSTTPAVPESLMMAGELKEWDGREVGHPDCLATLPDPLGVEGKTGILPGSELKPGLGTLSVHTIATCQWSGQTLDYELTISYFAE